MKKKFLALSASLFALFVALTLNINANAMDNYQNEDGETLYGWALETNDTDADLWEFDENGNPAAVYAAEGDTANQWTNNYAIRNLAIGADDNYTLQTTFTPDPETDLSVDRAYGLLVWYQDPDNFLIYWLQQKPSPEWSAQFYGRVDGVYKSFYFEQKYDLGNIGYMDDWRKGEFYDMWWDSGYANTELRNNRTAIVTNSVTLKVVSNVEKVTVAGVEESCRRFEFHQIVNGVDHITSAFYVRGINETSDEFYTGLYSEKFNVTLSDYSLEFDSQADIVKSVDDEISALPDSISAISDINSVIGVSSNYKTLLTLKSGILASNQEKIERLDAEVVTFVDSKIDGLDPNKPTYVEDVLALEELYFELPVEYADSLTKVDKLIEALENVENWEDPTLVKPVVEITTAATANAGDEVEITYNVSDNLTSAENLIVEVSVKKGITNVKLTDNKFVAEEGTYNIKVTAKDEHGNTGSATLTLTVTVVDTTKPEITISTPSTAKVGDEVEVKYSVTDNVSTGDALEVLVSVVKDGKNVSLTNNKFTAEAGTYTITVSAKDAAGNINQASLDVVVGAAGSSDTTKPTVTITTPSQATIGEVVLITYTATDDKSAANKLTIVVEVKKDGQVVEVSNNKFTAEAGTYTITVTATDEAGNSQTATSNVTVSAPAKSNGCGGSVLVSMFGISLLGATVILVKKRKDEE